MEHRVVTVETPRNQVRIGNGLPLTIIAGPCQAESYDLCEEVATTMQRLCEERGLGYIFKASFDKANRTDGSAKRGPGEQYGLNRLFHIRAYHGIPVTTDIHTPEQADAAARIVDIIQIPALLSRQTDLITAAGKTGAVVNIKKGQFMPPDDVVFAEAKVMSAGAQGVLITERGTTFGHGDLVVDYRGLPKMADLLWPVVFDASHSVQRRLPGSGSTGGQREFIAPLARAAVAVGVAAVFFEVHPNPNLAASDGPSTLALADAEAMLDDLVAIDRTRKFWPAT